MQERLLASKESLRVVYLTAGAGGMYCGSCLADNSLASALTRAGVDIQLIPTYTPIRTDEVNVSVQRVFFGGINVFLQQRIPAFRHIPSIFDRVLDTPRLIQWATRRQSTIDATQLGDLTISMLQGRAGHQKKEVDRLCKWLGDTVQPDVIHFSNVLIAGCAVTLKERLGVPLLVTLQGDDIFVDSLSAPHRAGVLGQIRSLSEHIDGFLVHTEFYADRMAGYLGIARPKFHQIRLGINTEDFSCVEAADDIRSVDNAEVPRPPTVGYLARLAPEKGLELLCEAFIRLRRKEGTANARLRIAGWIGDQHRSYIKRCIDRLKSAGCGRQYTLDGEVDRLTKVQFLKDVDVVSVPTIFEEPKGLYVLEALASATPVVQPNHGSFPEIIRKTGGGLLVPPNDAEALAEALHRILTQRQLRESLGKQGQISVQAHYGTDSMARTVMDIYQRAIKK